MTRRQSQCGQKNIKITKKYKELYLTIELSLSNMKGGSLKCITSFGTQTMKPPLVVLSKPIYLVDPTQLSIQSLIT